MDSEQRKQEMFGLIEQWQASGLSQRAWCKQISMARSTFRKWLGRYEDEYGIVTPQVDQPPSSSSPSFVSIELPPSGRDQLTINYPNGVQLRCPLSIGHAQLRSLVHLLD